MALNTVLRLGAPPSAVRAALHDAALVTSCLRGARLDAATGGRVEGRVSLRLGRATATYHGELVAADSDDGGMAVVLRATARGRGEVSGTLMLLASEVDGSTEVAIGGDLRSDGETAPAGAEIEAAVDALLHELGPRLDEALHTEAPAPPEPSSTPAVPGRVEVVTDGPVPAAGLPVGDGPMPRCQALLRQHPWLPPLAILLALALLLALRPRRGRAGG